MYRLKSMRLLANCHTNGKPSARPSAALAKTDRQRLLQ